MSSLKNNKFFLMLEKYPAFRYIFLPIKSFIYNGFLDNCGGKNNDIKSFAGNLLNEVLTEEEINKIYYNLIMKNGTCKMTNPIRNQAAIEKVLEQISKNQHAHEFSILEIGASNGIDAINNYENIKNIAQVKKYVLGDLYTEIFFDKKRQLIFDQDGNLLQVLKTNYFININFRFTYGYQRITNLIKYIHPYILRKRYKFINIDLVRIPLVHPIIALELQKSAVFQFQRLNVFKPIPGRFDIIICLNLLIDLYFNENNIQKGISNLKSILNPNGFILIGTTTENEIIFA